MKKNWILCLLAVCFVSGNAFAQYKDKPAAAWQWEDKDGNRIFSDIPPAKGENVRSIGSRREGAVRIGETKKSRVQMAEERLLKTRCLQARDKLINFRGLTAQEEIPPETYKEIDNLEQFVTNNCFKEKEKKTEKAPQ